MEIYQLKTFVTVAREGSITRASELLFASQPAVSAHIKALEDELSLTLFERTPRGMRLTEQGVRLLSKAEQLLALQRDLLDEADRIKGRLTGTLRLGSNRNPSAQVLGKLLAKLAESCPDIDVMLEYGNSAEMMSAIQRGTLDAGFYTDAGQANQDFDTIEIDRLKIFLAAPRGWVNDLVHPDWQQLANFPWVCPAVNTCCGHTAEHLFERHHFRPQKIINVDQESVTRTLIAGGVGVGLLHAETAREAEAKGEVDLLGGAQHEVRLLFAYLHTRAQEPLLTAVATAMREIVQS